MTGLKTVITSICFAVSSSILLIDAVASDFAPQTATALEIDFDANSAVYDSSRNVIYASIGSSAGFPNGNSILTIDPSNLQVISQISAGSEPTQLAISMDNSRVYVGINGARAFRYFTPDANELSPLVPLYSRYGDPAVAEDFAVSPIDPAVVVVSKDEVGSTADGDLEVFDDSGSIGETDVWYPDGNSIAFTSSNKLLSYNNTSTGYNLVRWNFDGSNLFLEDQISGLISGFGVEIESEGGMIYSTNGAVVDPNTLTLLGTFPASGAVESFANDGVTFYFDDGLLQVFDNATFLVCNIIDVSPFGMDATELFDAGGDRLGYVTSNGAIGVIKGVTHQDDCFSSSLSPDVKVNGSDVLLSAVSGESMNLSLSLDTGSSDGEMADIMIGLLSSDGFHPYFVGQSTVFNFPDSSVYQGPLPPGFNVWLFALDLNPDGVQEFTYIDWVPITVIGAEANSNLEANPDFNSIVEKWINSQRKN